MQKKAFLPGILILFIVSGCYYNNDLVIYHKFNEHTWPRFEPVRFEIPINPNEKMYNIYLFIHHTPEFEFDNLDFQMTMNTPSGEERIKEYRMNIRNKTGGFVGQCNKDSCEVSITLKKDLRLTKGILRLEIESLIPRLRVKGLLGIGIKLNPVR